MQELFIHWLAKSHRVVACKDNVAIVESTAIEISWHINCALTFGESVWTSGRLLVSGQHESLEFEQGRIMDARPRGHSVSEITGTFNI